MLIESLTEERNKTHCFLLACSVLHLGQACWDLSTLLQHRSLWRSPATALGLARKASLRFPQISLLINTLQQLPLSPAILWMPFPRCLPLFSLSLISSEPTPMLSVLHLGQRKAVKDTHAYCSHIMQGNHHLYKMTSAITQVVTNFMWRAVPQELW